MSANLVVDLGNTCYLEPSIATGSGLVYAASGATIGASLDLLNANVFTNVLIQGDPQFGSGQLRVQVQCSDTDTSGSYTDPTSGLAAFPTWMSSGGIFILNSGGLLGGTRSAAGSGHYIASGFAEAGAFQRPQRFTRFNVLSGDFYCGGLTVTAVANLKTIGSGAGFSYSPGSGTVRV